MAKTKAEREKERERKIGHRRVGVGGEITYKKIQTTQIMGSIQLGKFRDSLALLTHFRITDDTFHSSLIIFTSLSLFDNAKNTILYHD